MNWENLDAADLNFHIRQAPEPLNVLGAVKFAMMNKYEIYLHDTPYQEDFGKAFRAYSHGCIRVEKPIDLAVRVLKGRNGWTAEGLREAISLGAETKIDLARAVEVYFQYGTAWADEEGTVQFRLDSYQLDRKTYEALGRPAPWRLPKRIYRHADRSDMRAGPRVGAGIPAVGEGGTRLRSFRR